MIPHIIGLLGRAGSGKSTVARYLSEKHGARIFSLAMPLKEIARDVFDFTQEQLYGTQAQKEAIDARYGFSPRWLLQRLGTEGIRKHLGRDVFTQATMRAIQEHVSSCFAKEQRLGLAVIDDLRFPDEVLAVCRAYGRVIKLVCSDDATSTPTHASEAAVDDVSALDICWTTIRSHRSPGSAHLIGELEKVLGS